MATKLKSYSTTPGSNNSAAPNGWPEGMLPSSVNDSAREMMARLAEWYQDAEWLLRNDTVTAFTGTTLTITGDVTAAYAVGRLIRLDESNSKRALITAASFAAGNTTVTVVGYTILATPTAIELGILNLTETTIRPRIDVASAATTDLDSAAYRYVRITGTTTITAITLSEGRVREVLAGGDFSITAGASLVITGVASGQTLPIITGDTFRVIGEASGVVRVLGITRTSEHPDNNRILGQSAVAASVGAVTTEATLATITVPASAMGANGRLRIRAFFTTNNNANNKTVRVRFSGASGTIFAVATFSTITDSQIECHIANRNATNSQIGNALNSYGASAETGAAQTGAIDTTAATTVVITGQKANSGDTITLESYSVELMRSA